MQGSIDADGTRKWGKSNSITRYNYQIGKRLTAAAYKEGVNIAAGTDYDQELFVQAEINCWSKK